jgi:hypothetical protein
MVGKKGLLDKTTKGEDGKQSKSDALTLGAENGRFTLQLNDSLAGAESKSFSNPLDVMLLPFFKRGGRMAPSEQYQNTLQLPVHWPKLHCRYDITCTYRNEGPTTRRWQVRWSAGLPGLQLHLYFGRSVCVRHRTERAALRSSDRHLSEEVLWFDCNS